MENTESNSNAKKTKTTGRIVTADQKNDKTWKNVNKAKEVINKTKQQNK